MLLLSILLVQNTRNSNIIYYLFHILVRIVEMAPNDQEKVILERQINGLSIQGEEKRSLLSYSTTGDKIIILISFTCAILGGILNPLIAVP